MNLYRGCTHGCIYCDSRSECYGFTHDFEDVEIKQNAPELLEVALRRKRARCMIGTGSMCDPYLPLEKTERLTRRCLEIIDRYGFGAAVLTKSDLVLRDIDLFQSIHRKAKCVVQMTLTNCDEALCRVLEPNVATTRRRVEALLELKKAGIPTVVWLTPLLPFVNDTEANVRGLLAYCEEADVKGILTFGAGMTLRNGDREYYYQKLDEYFPGLKQRYIQTYGNAYELQSPDAPRLHGLMREFCAERGVLFGAEPVFAYLSTLEPKAEQTTFL